MSKKVDLQVLDRKVDYLLDLNGLTNKLDQTVNKLNALIRFLGLEVCDGPVIRKKETKERRSNV